mgnify:CR=1 FL=1
MLSRRWALFALAVVLIAYACWWLGEWQFGRLADRKASNAIVRTNEDRPPTPVGEVVQVGGTVPTDDEWRVVSARGVYDPADTVVVRYRTRDGEAGVDAVVPLVTDDGTSLLVDRGWLATDNQGSSPAELDIPAPPSGKVTVTGYLRLDGTGESTTVTDDSTRAVSSVAIGQAQNRTVYPGFVELKSETPAAADNLEPVELPELDNGPHFFYGLQWWFFGVLAVFGFSYLLYDERRNGTRGARAEAGRVSAPGPFASGPLGAGPFGSGRSGGSGGSGEEQPVRERKPKKVRQTNHPYARMRAEAEARAAAEAAARDAHERIDDPARSGADD